MRVLNKVLLGLLVLFIVIQFIRPARNKSDQASQADLISTFNVPENVQIILLSACYDCHSNNSKYPWYSNIQPFGWMLANHIKKGKAELNFSNFGSYSQRRQISKMNGVANSVKDGSMPLSSYTIMHKKARLSGNERTLLIDWAIKIKDSLRSSN